jgi:DNA-binding MarR family transcriptional regulator
MSLFTSVQVRMLRDIHEHGGQVRSLWQMSDRLNIDYSGAHRRMRELVALGAIQVQRDGRCLVISLQVERQG